METPQLIFVGVTALMLTMLLMPVAERLSFAAGAVDRPDVRKVHARAMPRLGGLAIVVALFASIVLFLGFFSHDLVAFLAGLAIVTLTGLVDDIRHLSAKQKFAGEILAAIVFLLLSGASLTSFGNLLGFGDITFASLALPVTVFAMVGVMNAMNLSDGLDGLAGGLSTVACIFFAYFAFDCNATLCLALSVALFGSLLGFLYYNTHPARIFMGDTGSLALGYSLAAISLLLVHETGAYAQPKPISLAMILGLPIMDTLLVMSRRMLQGKSPFSPDKTHLHHRLMDLGIPHAAVVSIMYVIMMLYGLLAVLLNAQPEWLQLIVGLMFSAVIFGGIALMQRWGLSEWVRAQRRSSKHPQSSFRQSMTVALGHSVRWVTWLLPAGLMLPIWRLHPAKNMHVMLLPLIAALFLLLFFPWQARQSRLAAWVHGMIYVLVFMLLALLNLFGDEGVRRYLMGFAMLLAIWVVLKLVFKRHGQVLMTSGIELLLIFTSWFTPVMVVPHLELQQEAQDHLLMACIEAVPFLLAMKILLRRQAARNRTLLIGLAGCFLLIMLKPVLSGI